MWGGGGVAGGSVSGDGVVGDCVDLVALMRSMPVGGEWV